MHIHFIGIGGIGVSALARYYLTKGHKVSGSDLVSSEITDALKKIGAKIVIGPHKVANVPKNADLIIYSPAVQPNNPELQIVRGETSNIRIMSYPEALGELTKSHFTIAISGTHGKSTTTSMIGLLLVKAGFDPTVIVGTKVREFNGSNCRVGKSKYLVIEADEHMASFLNYSPKIIVLTNIEADHLDYYKNLNNIIKTFREYIGHLLKGGMLVANKDDTNTKQLAKSRKQKTVFYSTKQPETKKIKKMLQIPGKHNISNALAALAVARILKIPDKVSFRALSEFKGTWRRFDISNLRLSTRNLQLISDYGHHPTEVKVTLQAAREKYPKKKIWCVFQPHQYQRTYYLFNDFVKVLKSSPVDKLIITDIYDVAGRETPEMRKKVSSEKLVETINKSNVIYLPKKEIANYLKKELKGGQALIVMGAGDIYNLTSELK